MKIGLILLIAHIVASMISLTCYPHVASNLDADLWFQFTELAKTLLALIAVPAGLVFLIIAAVKRTKPPTFAFLWCFLLVSGHLFLRALMLRYNDAPL